MKPIAILIVAPFVCPFILTALVITNLHMEWRMFRVPKRIVRTAQITTADEFRARRLKRAT